MVSPAQADAQLFNELDDKLARLLFPERFQRPLQVTVVFAPLEGAAGRQADELTAAASESSLAPAPDRPGTSPVHRCTFSVEQVEQIEALHALYIHLVQSAATNLEILVNDRPLPLVRELWLPLLWTLRP